MAVTGNVGSGRSSDTGNGIQEVALKHWGNGLGVIYAPGSYDPQTLLDGTITTGAGPAVTLTGGGGQYTINVRGTFNTSPQTTVTLQNVGLDNATFENTVDGSGVQIPALTAPGSITFRAFKGAILRLVIAGGAPTLLRAQVGGLSS